MTTIKSLSYAGIGSIALAMLTPSVSFAEAGQAAAANANTGNQVHRVSHSLAGASTYTGSTSGYKWGNKPPMTNTADTQWTDSTTRSGYKWGNSSSDSKPESQSYAGASSYQWGTMGVSDQSGYRWGVRNYSDQAGYRWGVRNNSDQTGYRWGVRNDSDQTGYRWGVRNNSDQTGYRWGVR